MTRNLDQSVDASPAERREVDTREGEKHTGLVAVNNSSQKVRKVSPVFRKLLMDRSKDSIMSVAQESSEGTEKSKERLQPS